MLRKYFNMILIINPRQSYLKVIKSMPWVRPGPLVIGPPTPMELDINRMELAM